MIIEAELLVNLKELKNYELLKMIADNEKISLIEAVDLVLSHVEVKEENNV